MRLKLTHNKGFEVEAAVMEWPGANGFERLLPTSSYLILELMSNKIVDRVPYASVVAQQVLKGGNLNHPKGAVVAEMRNQSVDSRYRE